MVREARYTVENGTYHVMLRGNDKRIIFRDSPDYQTFLNLLIHIKKRYLFVFHHYVLMNNHVHLILQTSNGEQLSQGIKSLTVRYVNYFRKKYGGIGHFFQDRFKSFLIADGDYLLQCGRYVELNPVKALLVENAADYPWSSAAYYLENSDDSWLTPNPEWLALGDDYFKRQEIYSDYLTKGFDERRSLTRYFKIGFCGSEDQLKVLKKSGLNVRWSHSGRPSKLKK